jgi:hypothetical protein
MTIHANIARVAENGSGAQKPTQQKNTLSELVARSLVVLLKLRRWRTLLQL